MMIRNTATILSLCLFLASPSYAHQGAHLGKIEFLTSGSKNAQPYFEQGVMLLHSFEYNEARAEFQKAEQIDPDFVMAYWGEAMTFNHPLWIEQNFKAGSNTLEKLAATASERIQKAKTPKEKGFIKAINLLYGKGDKKYRDIAYADAMRELYHQYPNDDEIASFYALALLGETEGERDSQLYMQAAGIVEEIYSRNPNHPGAVHYAIHSYDDPIHAPLGLRAARTYAKMAPDASHALHMPSHIFLAMGMWDDVIAANKAAWEAGLKQNASNDPKEFKLDDLHAIQWLSYGYLQKKQYQTAYYLTKIMETIAESTNTSSAKWYYAVMRAAYIAASHDFNGDLKSSDMSNIELSARVSDLYVNGLIALNNHDAKKAKTILNDMSQIIPQHMSKQKTYPDYFTSMTVNGITSSKIMAMELNAQIYLHEGKMKDAIKILKEATHLEDQLSFGYGPPIPIQPSYELLADALMQSKQYSAAYHQYVITLKRMPNRIESKQGLDNVSKKLKEAKLQISERVQPYFHKLMLGGQTTNEPFAR